MCAAASLIAALRKGAKAGATGGGPSLSDVFLSDSLLNLFKVQTQRAFSSERPTLQMARGSEAVSTLKRAKSRDFSPAGEDPA